MLTNGLFYLSYHLRSKLDDQTRLDWGNSVLKIKIGIQPMKVWRRSWYHKLLVSMTMALILKNLKNQETKEWNLQLVKWCFRTSVSSFECRNCRKDEHLLIGCANFLSKSPYQWYSVTKKLGICLHCFGNGHSNAKYCQSVCKECGKKKTLFCISYLINLNQSNLKNWNQIHRNHRLYRLIHQHSRRLNKPRQINCTQPWPVPINSLCFPLQLFVIAVQVLWCSSSPAWYWFSVNSNRWYICTS